MSPTRRKFLGYLAAGPIAGKKIAEGTMRNAGVAVMGVSNRDFVDGPSPSLVTEKGFIKRNDVLRQIFQNGLPKFKQEQFRIQAKSNRVLDPDIAEMRSPSLSAKLRMQAKRNYDELVNRELSFPDMDDERESFLTKWGLGWF